MVDGGGAELARAEEWQVQRLPDRATFQQGAAMGVPYGTAWRALFLKAKARPGETVLVHGASGGVGTAAVQLARAHGMRVIGTAGTDEGLRLVREQGAHEVLNHREPDYLTKIPALTNGRGADVILEMLANVNLDRDLDVLAPHGRIMVIGNRGRVEIDPRKMMGKDGRILGMTLFNTTREEFTEIHAGARRRTRERHVEPGDPEGDAARAGAAGARRGDGTGRVRKDRAGALTGTGDATLRTGGRGRCGGDGDRIDRWNGGPHLVVPSIGLPRVRCGPDFGPAREPAFSDDDGSHGWRQRRVARPLRESGESV